MVGNSIKYSDIIKKDNVSLVNRSEDRALTVERKMPIKHITINNIDLKKTGLFYNIKYLKITENEDGLSFAEIRFYNENLSFTDDSIFQEQNIVQIWTGYQETGLEKRGSFRINKVTTKFDVGQETEIIVECVSPEYDMMATERRETYFKMKDSDIAARIADFYGFDISIQDTERTYPQVTKVNISDWDFLKKRAKLYGYQLYIHEDTVRGKMVLHFHEPYLRGPVIGPIQYGGGNRASLESFHVYKSNTFAFGKKTVYTGADPISGEFISLASSEEEESVFQRELRTKRDKNDAVLASNVSAVNGEQPKEFLIHLGHIRDRAELSLETQRVSEFSRYYLFGVGVIIGLERIKKRSIIRITNIGRYSGFWYVTKAVHSIIDIYQLRIEAVQIVAGEQLELPDIPKYDIFPEPTQDRDRRASGNFIDKFKRNNPVRL